MAVYKGYTPCPWQREVHNFLGTAKNSGKIAVVKSKRQCGKSFMCENQLLFYAINYKFTTNAMITPTLSQARKVFKELCNAIVATGVIKSKNASLLELELINGSQIFFKSAEQKDSLRGFTISGILILDEATFLSDDILELVMPWCNVHKAPILMVSTPKMKQGFYYRYFMRGLTNDGVVKSFDWNNYDTSRFLSNEQLAEYEKLMPKAQFRTEYLGEFADDNCGVFEGFRDCILSEPKPYKKLYIGIDWANGGGNDDTVISALNENGEQVFLFHFNTKSNYKQIEFIGNFLEEHKNNVALVVPELNSIGTPMTEYLQRRCPWCNIQGHNTTNASKNDIVNKLQLAFEQQKIHIINDEKQLMELSMYTLEFNINTKSITYNAPQGFNDDICIALALSWKAFDIGANVGQYYFYIN